MKPAISGGIAATTLAAVGGLHILWAADPWPWDSAVEMRTAVFGSADSDVPKAGYVLMGGVLAGSAAVVASQSRILPRFGSDRLRSAAMYALSGGLLLRGAGGLLLNSGAAEEFQRLNTTVYSPLCLGLAALTFLAHRDSRDRSPSTV